MSTILHTLHVVLAGAWLGGIVFTTAVVSPALKAMKWAEAERVSVRSVIGKQYAKIGSANLVLLLIFALLDGWTVGFGTVFYAEYALLAALFGLVAAHGAYFGRKLVGLAEAEKETENPQIAKTFANRRRRLQRLSGRVSLLDLLVSAAIAILVVNT